MVLSRIVTKPEYGHFQAVISTAGVVCAFGDFGVYRVLVSRQDYPLADMLEAASVVSLVAYSLYAVVSIVCGVSYAQFYGDASLVWVGILYAVNLIAIGYYGLQVAGLARDLRFARMAGAEIATIVITALSGIGLALAGAGIYSLVLPPLISQLVAIALLQ